MVRSSAIVVASLFVAASPLFGASAFATSLPRPATAPVNTVITVTGSSPQGWGSAAEPNSSPGVTPISFDIRFNPAPILGSGNASFVLTDTTVGKLYGASVLTGTPLSSLVVLSYSTFLQSGNGGPTIQIGWDDDATDANTGWRGRLFFAPSGMLTGQWQTWNALDDTAGRWYNTLPGLASNTCTLGISPSGCTWSQILLLFPNAVIHAGYYALPVPPNTPIGFVGVKAGSNATGVSYFDGFTIGTASASTTYDFEPTYTTITVTPAITQGWASFAELSGSTTVTPIALDIQSVPAPALGIGTPRFELTQINVGKIYASSILTGTKLSDLLVLTYSTYKEAGGDIPSIQLGWDDNANDPNIGFRGRLVFVPNAPSTGTWQTWNALSDSAGTWFTTLSGASVCTQSSPCAWSQVLTNYPNAIVHDKSSVFGPYGFVGVKAGSGGTGTSYFDGLTLAADQNVVTYDLEPNCNPYRVFNMSTGEGFCTIQAAIDDANTVAGNTISVTAGTFIENVTVNKQLTLRGAQAGQDAAARAAAFVAGKADPAIETVIQPPANSPTGNNPGAMDLFRVLTSSVTLDGFVLDGNNASLGSSTIVMEGVAAHARRGLTNIGNDNNFYPVNNLVVQNNIIQNIGQRGISLANNGPVSTGNRIEKNVMRRVHDQAIILFSGAYADVLTNTVDVPESGIGIHLQAFFSDGSMTWRANDVTVMSDTIGIHANLFSTPNGRLTITGNTVKAAPGVTFSDYTWGINVWSILTEATVAVTDNIVGASGGQLGRGINVWNVPTAKTIEIAGGSVQNSGIGINLDSIDPYFGAGATSVLSITNVTLTSTAGNTGVRVRVEPLSSPLPLSGSNTPNSMRAIIRQSRITGAGIGVLALTNNAGVQRASALVGDSMLANNAVGVQASNATVTATGNAITGSTTAGLYSTGASPVLSATQNTLENNGKGIFNDAPVTMMMSMMAVESSESAPALNPRLSPADDQGNAPPAPPESRETKTNALAAPFRAGPPTPSVSANYNNIAGNTSFGVENAGSGTLDASLNWWDAADGPGPIAAGSGDNISAGVAYCPWLGSAMPGGATTLMYRVYNVDTNEGFCTIQAAIDDASTVAGNTISVTAGTYAEVLTITKGITLAGNAGATIMPPFDLSTFTSPRRGALIWVDANNVTIRNLIINGDNPAFGGGFPTSGGEMNVARAIYLRNQDGQVCRDGLRVENNVIRNVARGVNPYCGNNIVVQNNQFYDLGIGANDGNYGYGVLLHDTANGIVANNTITNAATAGVFSQNSYTGQPITFTNNVITNAGIGLGVNLFYGNGNAVVQNNTVYSASLGMQVTSIQNGKVTIQNNAFTFTQPEDWGFIVWNVYPNTTQMLTNTLSGGDIGVQLTDKDSTFGFSQAVSNTLVMRGNSIQNANIGVQVSAQVVTAGVSLSATGNTISGSVVAGVQITGTSGVNAQINNNNLVGNGIGIRNTTSTVVNGTLNWWNAANGPGAIAGGSGDKVSANVTYCAWLDAPAPGGTAFYPVVNMNTTEGFCTIQAAINDSDTVNGHTISVTAGVYNENVNVTKVLTITGAGNGSNPGTSTIVKSPAANVPVVTLVTGGSSATSRQVLQNMRLTGGNGTPSSNTSSGVLANQNVSFVTFDNVAVVGNAGYGISFNAASGIVTDVQILNSDISSNAIGIRVGTYPYVNGFTLKNSTVLSNSVIGLALNQSIIDGNTSTNIVIEGTTFTANGFNSFGQSSPATLGFGDISLNGFNGNVTIKDVVVNGLASNGAQNGIQLRGSNTPRAMGVMILDNVQVTGSYRRPSNAGSNPGGPGNAIILFNYAAGGSLSMSNVIVTATDGHALSLLGLTNPVNLGNSSLTASNSNAFHINVGFSTQNNVPSNADATSTSLGGVPAGSATLAQLYAIEDKVFHGVDAGGPLLGFVRVRAGNVYVTPNSFAAPLFPTPSIQRGVDVASAGDTLNVQAGTYTGQVNVNKSLTLIGDNKTTTFIKSPATLSGDIIGASLVGITNTASVTMTGFTFAGPKEPPLTCAPSDALMYGVRVMGGGKLTLSDSAVTDIRDNPLSGCQTGIAVRAGSAFYNQVGHLIMTNVVITGYQKGGVIISGPGSTGDLTGNTLTGYGNQPSIAANSVQISDSAVATMTGNTISANKCDLAGVCTPDPITGTFSSGVLLYDAGAVVLTGNIISDTDAGIYSYAPNTPAVIENNTLLNNRWHGVYVDGGQTTVLSNTITGSLNGVVVASYLANTGDSNANVYSNTINGANNGVLMVDEGIADTFKPVLDAQFNTITNSVNAGVNIETTGATTATIKQNVIAGANGVINNAPPAAISVNRNDLSLNTSSAISNTNAGLLKGECNWFGSNAGPGASVLGNVDANPWLTTSNLNGDCSLATLVVEKVVTGNTPFAAWQFAGPTGTFTLPAAGGSITLTGLDYGPTRITETVKPGFVATSSCTGGATGSNVVTPTLLGSDTVTCTFTNAITLTYSTITVTPAITQGWGSLAEPPSGAGTIIPFDIQSLPTPALGIGNASFELTNINVGKMYVTSILTGTKLSDLLVLTYSTYLESGNGGPTIQIGWDDDSTVADVGYRGRIFFAPTGMLTGQWQTWNALSDTAGRWYTTLPGLTPNTCAFPGPGGGCTWSQLLSLFPNAIIHNDVFAPGIPKGLVGVKAGSNATGVSHFDGFTIAANENVVTYDFEPACTAYRVFNVNTGEGFCGIQQAIDDSSTVAGNTISVTAGVYTEAVNLNKSNLYLIGASGAASTTIVGPKNGAGNDTVLFSAPGVTVDGFTITRDGNNPTDWAGNVRNQGANMASGGTLKNSILTGNRNAVLVSVDNTQIVSNSIVNNRTGIHIQAPAGNVTVTNNIITGNWTIGILFRQPTSNNTGWLIQNNRITDNWYSQLEDRGNPAGLTRTIESNYWGVSPFSLTIAINSGEPGYLSQIPVAFGGSAVPPASTPTFVVNSATVNPADSNGIGNPNTARLDFEPWLCDGTDTSPAIGFQPITTTQCDATPPDTFISSAPVSPTASTTATFVFSGTDTVTPEALLTFECSLNGGAFGACTSPITNTGLADGLRTFDVRAVDPDGMTDTTPATHTWLVDTTAPNTLITSAPVSPTAAITSVFAFNGTDSGAGVAGFECRLNSGAWTTCASPITYTSGLSEGLNTFDVRAIDAVSNTDATPATHTWTLDTTGPETTIILSPTTPTNAPFATFTFTATDVGGTGVVGFECSLDGGTFTTCTSPQVFTGITNGPHTFAVRAVDAVGNPDSTPATHNWLVDLVAPVTSITSAPASPTNTTSATLVFTGTDTGGSGIAFFEYRLDGSAWLSTTNTTVSYTGLSNGAHQFDVRAVDNVGNVDLTYATVVWVVDPIAPSTSISSAPASMVLTSTATLVYTGTDAGGSGLAYFEYTLNGGAPVTTTDTMTTFTGLADGAYTFMVAAVDNVGNVDATPASANWTVDTQAPETTITISPTTPTSSTAASIAFTGSDSGSGVASFMCSLDGATAAPCVSPVILIGLGDGAHTFTVYAIDNVGNPDLSPASATWTVDATAPTTSITSSPASQTNTASATFSFTGDDGSGVGGITFQCSLDGGAWASCNSPASYTGLSDGTHTFMVRALDAVSNIDSTPESFTWLVDTTAPDAIITIAPAALISSTSASVTFTATDGAGSGVASFECKLDSGAWASCSSPAPLNSLPDGLRLFSVRSIDNVGNVETSVASTAFTVDATPPTTTIDLAPPAIDSSNASFAFSGGDGTGSGVAGFECKLDTGAWAACASPAAYVGLSAGPHTFEVRAVDVAGNADASPSSHSWTVDGDLPNTEITPTLPAATTDTNVTIVFTGTDATTPASALTFECSFDGSSFAPCTSPFTQSGLAQGTHTFQVRAVDDGNNVDPSPATVTWLVDTAAPDTTITSAPPAITSSNSAVITFIGTDALAPASSLTFECSVDGAAFAACTSPLALTNLANGTHTVDVRAKDTAGNVDPTPATTSWLVDATAPDTTITAQPANPTNQTGASFSFSSSGSLSAVTYECKLDAGAWAACNTPHALAGLSDGSHTLQVRATSAAGLIDATPATYTWVVDATAPDTTITAQPPAVAGSSASFAFTGSDGSGTGVASFECRLDSGAWAACASPQNLASLSDGSHTFSVRAIDAVGNVDSTPATHTWTADSNLPETVLLSTPPANAPSNNAAFTFVGTDNTAPASAITFECRLDGGAWGACTSPQSYTGLSDGSHTFEVRSVDAGGNIDPTPASFTWSVNTGAPDTVITSGPMTRTFALAATFEFTGTDSVSPASDLTFECRLDEGAWQACSSPRAYSNLAGGVHVFEVRATDPAGNVDATPARLEWTIVETRTILTPRVILPMVMQEGR